MKACIILNGQILNYEVIKDKIDKEEYDYIICCDGGANHVYNMNLIPDYIIGDLDSIKNDVLVFYKNKDVLFKKFNKKKDETDTELAIYLAKEIGVSKIDFFASLGNRIDHTIANINLLYKVRKEQIHPRIISEQEEIYIIIDEKIIIYGNKGDTVSVIPLKSDVKGVSLYRLEYPLKNQNMSFGTPLGVSNVMLENSCEIEVEKGSLIIIKNI